MLELDPDVILVLVAPQEKRSPAAFVADFQRFTSLGAVKSGRVRAVAAPEAFANGPRILLLADRLERELREVER